MTPDPSTPRPLLSVVIPAFNEAFTIAEILRRVDSVPVDKEIIVIDDGSTDGTRDHLARIEAAWPDEDHPHSTFRVLLQPHNMGKGRAVRAGIAEARGRITLIQDADLEYDPRDYDKLIQPILDGVADVVYGSRFDGTPRRVLYFWHMVGNVLLTTLSNMLNDINLTDMETCYKAFRTEVIQSIPLEQDRFGFEPEVTAKVSQLGLRIYEVPVAYFGRTYAEGKKINWRDGVQAVQVMLKYSGPWAVDRNWPELRYSTRVRRLGAIQDWLLELVGDHLGGRIIEVGAGRGELSRALVSRERLVLTSDNDVDLEALEALFKDLDHVSVVRWSADEPVADTMREARADTVLLAGVLQTVDDDAVTLARMRDLLVDGGRAVVVVPASRAVRGAMDEALGWKRRYSRKDLRARLEEAGFSVVLTRHVAGVALPAWFVHSRLLGRSTPPRGRGRLLNRVSPLLGLEKRVDLGLGLYLVAVAER